MVDQARQRLKWKKLGKGSLMLSKRGWMLIFVIQLLQNTHIDIQDIQAVNLTFSQPFKKGEKKLGKESLI